MVEARTNLVKATISQSNSLLNSDVLPLEAKLAFYKAVIVPRALYGAEVWSMRDSLLVKMQSALNMALRQILSVSRWADMRVVWRELDCPPIAASEAAKKVRLFQKAGDLLTWFKDLVATSIKTRIWCPTDGYRRQMGRWRKNANQDLITPEQVREYLWDRSDALMSHRRANSLREGGEVGLWKGSGGDSELNRFVLRIIRWRVDAPAWGPRLAHVVPADILRRVFHFEVGLSWVFRRCERGRE